LRDRAVSKHVLTRDFVEAGGIEAMIARDATELMLADQLVSDRPIDNGHSAG
jgi:hypothetical protein